MSARDEDRQWLEANRDKYRSGWEAKIVSEFGIEGALDLLACQAGRAHEVDLRHTPFVRNGELKLLVIEAREALSTLATEAYSTWYESIKEDD